MSFNRVILSGEVVRVNRDGTALEIKTEQEWDDPQKGATKKDVILPVMAQKNHTFKHLQPGDFIEMFGWIKPIPDPNSKDGKYNKNVIEARLV